MCRNGIAVSWSVPWHSNAIAVSLSVPWQLDIFVSGVLQVQSMRHRDNPRVGISTILIPKSPAKQAALFFLPMPTRYLQYTLIP